LKKQIQKDGKIEEASLLALNPTCGIKYNNGKISYEL